MAVVNFGYFEWDPKKSESNFVKHGIEFYEASRAFLDVKRVIATDQAHSHLEERYFCIGKTELGIMTVRFTYREKKIRLIGAGFWRKGKKLYEKENNIKKNDETNGVIKKSR